MHLQGITFVGTRTAARTAMVVFVRDVLGLVPARIDGMDADVFALRWVVIRGHVAGRGSRRRADRGFPGGRRRAG